MILIGIGKFANSESSATGTLARSPSLMVIDADGRVDHRFGGSAA
jgi:hypothetical protein